MDMGGSQSNCIYGYAVLEWENDMKLLPNT